MVGLAQKWADWMWKHKRSEYLKFLRRAAGDDPQAILYCPEDGVSRGDARAGSTSSQPQPPSPSDSDDTESESEEDDGGEEEEEDGGGHDNDDAGGIVQGTSHPRYLATLLPRYLCYLATSTHLPNPVDAEPPELHLLPSQQRILWRSIMSDLPAAPAGSCDAARMRDALHQKVRKGPLPEQPATRYPLPDHNLAYDS